MRTIFFTTFSLLFVNCVIAQTINIKEPEFAGNIVYVNDTIGNGVRLEQQTASSKTSANAAAYIPGARLVAGKATSKNVVNGCCSPIQIEQKTNVRFIVKVKDNSFDPTTIINIFKLKVEKEKRTVELASSNTWGTTKAGEIEFVTFYGTKYGESSYLIEIPNLESGEYAMTLADRRDFFNLFQIKE